MKVRFSRATIAAIGFALIAGYFLWAEHAAHIKLAIPYLPYLLLLACPLLHLFMHGGHGHHGTEHQGHTDSDRETPTATANRPPQSSSLPRTERNHE